MSPAAQWGWGEILANKSNYLLETLVWMKTKDATKRQPVNKPKPFLPEFLKEYSQMNEGSELHDTEDVRKILEKPRL